VRGGVAAQAGVQPVVARLAVALGDVRADEHDVVALEHVADALELGPDVGLADPGGAVDDRAHVEHDAVAHQPAEGTSSIVRAGRPPEVGW